jgi:twitching motility protein PilT
MQTILVVEDSESMQRIVAIAFGHEPFSLLRAWTAAEGVTCAKTQRPDLVVLDHGLPDGSGYDVAARLRADPSTAALPIVLLTSEQDPFDAARGRAAGITAHLQKPFECDDLLLCARQILGVVAAPPPRAAPSPVESTAVRSARLAPASPPNPTTPPTTPPSIAAVTRTTTQPGLVALTATSTPPDSDHPMSLPRTTGGAQVLALPGRMPTPGLRLPGAPDAAPGSLPPTIVPLPLLNIQVASGAEHQWLHDLLHDAASQGASDIHVHATGPMRMRRFSTLWSLPDSALPVDTIRRALMSLLSDDDLVRFEADGQVDFGLSLPRAGRFRVNIYRQQGGVDGVFRVVQREPPTLASLRMPSSLARLTTLHQGIVLLTGPGASGKSSTMAALLRAINEARSDHVVTIEDPIEVLHPSIRCVINQRQASRHTKSFARALKAALREDPDVIVIGEMRDRETAQLALTAAETGHLVLATLHTQSAVATINRVVGEFPPAQQPNVRAMLSESLRAIVSQRLLPRKDGSGVVPAVELLLNTPAVANLIREQRAHQIRTVMQTGAALGMQTLDASLNELVAEGLVDLEVARRQADDPRSVKAPGAARSMLPVSATPSTPPTVAAMPSTLPTNASTLPTPAATTSSLLPTSTTGTTGPTGTTGTTGTTGSSS